MSSERSTKEKPDTLSGSLEKVSLPNLLISLQNSKKTGTMDILSKYELTIFIDQGYPYFSAGGSGETLLGKILLNKNKITKYQYNKAAEEIKKNKDMRIGEILVKLGMITPHELNDYLEMQLSEKILESFLYLEGNFEFNETKKIDNSIFYSKINTPELIHDGLQKYLKNSDIDLQNLDVSFIDSLSEHTTNIGLGPKELRLVQLLSQQKSLNEIENSGKFKKDEILRVVLLLGLYDMATIKNFSINEYLIEMFKNFRVINPLPAAGDSDQSIKESELTDPTGEVLLLDDELEATLEREKLELNKKKELVEKEASEAEKETEAKEVVEEESTETEIETDENAIEIDEQDIKINDPGDNFNFQDKYEGDQHPIDIDKPKKKKKQAKKKVEEEKEVKREDDVVELNMDDLDEQKVMDELKKVESMDSGDEPSIDDTKEVSETATENEETIEKSAPPKEEEAQEEEVRLDLSEPDPEPEVEEELQDESSGSNDEAEVENSDANLDELNDFYEFIQSEDDYYEILRISTDATSEEIKDVYYQLIKKFHPDANSNFPEDIRIKAEQIFTKVTKAYEVLLDEGKRIEYDKRDELNKLKDKANSIYEAELIYTEGEMLLRQRNYKEAEKKFFSAIEMNPDESAYIGMYSWAKYLAAPDKDRVIEDVKKELNRAIEMDPSVEQNYYYLGSIYKFTENFSRAEKNFKKAVEIDPNYIEAKRELRLIKNRKTQKGKVKDSDKKIEKKFWSGLFKK